MRYPRLFKQVSIICLATSVSACSFLDKHDRRSEYRKSATLPALEIPPELDAALENDMMIPGGTATTYSDYNRNRAEGRPGAKTDPAIMPQPMGMTIQRDGQQRWLVIDKPVDRLWDKVRDFWLESGFLLNREDQKLGIVETQWTENRGDIPQDIVRRTLGKVADFLWAASTRDKFRTRLERNSDGSRTEVFVTHRGAEQVSQGEEFVWQFRPNDPELEAEMLTRLMVYLGLSEKQAELEVAQAQNKPVIGVEKQGDALLLAENFPRAWRRTGLVLDRNGFTVEDRNRDEGIYFVRFVPDDASDDEKGFLDKLAFWRSSEPESREFQIKLTEIDAQTRINILNKDGQPAEANTTEQLLKVLLEKLR